MSSKGNSSNNKRWFRRDTRNKSRTFSQKEKDCSLENLSLDDVFDQCMDNNFAFPKRKMMFSLAKDHLRNNKFKFVPSSVDKKFHFAVRFSKNDFVFERSKMFWMCHPNYTLEEWNNTILNFNVRPNLDANLQYIDFSSCDIFDSHLEQDSELFVFLSQRKHVEVLDLSNNFLTKQSVPNIEKLFRILENLKVIVLFSNNISEEDLLELTQSLKTKFGTRFGVVFRENIANPHRAYIRHDVRCLVDEKPGSFIGKSVDYYSESVHDVYYRYIVPNYIRTSIKNFIQNPKTITRPLTAS